MLQRSMYIYIFFYTYRIDKGINACSPFRTHYWLMFCDIGFFYNISTIKLFIKKKTLLELFLFPSYVYYKHALPIITCAWGYQVLFALENMYQVCYIVCTLVHGIFYRVYLKICLIFFPIMLFFIYYLFLC